MITQCVSCQGRFTAKRAHAKYCSERCRKRVQRGSEQPPTRQVGAPLVAVPRSIEGDGADSAGGFTAMTTRKLEAAGRLDDYLGMAALYMAKVLDTSPAETGNGHAALIKEYVARMDAALEGANVKETPLERMKRQRTLKAG